MDTSTDFYIRNINIVDHEVNNYIAIEVIFFSKRYDFGELGPYHESISIPDIDLLEKWELNNEIKDSFSFLNEEKPNGVETVLKRIEEAIEFGLISPVMLKGRDVIDPLEQDNFFIYEGYSADCLISRSAVVQLSDMKREMEERYCRWGHSPEFAGCFHSGDQLEDFLSILKIFETLCD